MIYPIVCYGDTVLRKVAQEIPRNTDLNISEIAQNLFETMYAASGVGLAAPQVGMSIRMFVVDGNEMEDDELRGFKKIFINPTLLDEEGEEWGFEEGCLSIPNLRETVYRPEKVKIHYFDENWNEFTEEYTGMKARVIQHEYDHLEGVLFIDYLNPLKKRLLQSKLKNISKGNVEVNYRVRFAK